MAGVMAPTVIAPRVEMTVFDLSWGHFIVVAVVALIVIGPKELPGVLRNIGQWTTRVRRMAAEFQGQVQEALREAEVADLHKEIGSIRDTARGFTSSLNDPVHLDDAMKWDPKPETPALPADTPVTPGPATAEAATPEAATPETVTPETVIPETVIPETVIPEAAAEATPAPAPLNPPRFNPEGFEPEVRRDGGAAVATPAPPEASLVEQPSGATAAAPGFPDGDAARGGEGGAQR